MIRALFQIPELNSRRIRLAYAAAIVADACQIALGPLGWVGAAQVIDVLAMAATWRLLGFHVLLLPTFVLELIPIVDAFPTWTGCVAGVILLRKREGARAGQDQTSTR